MARTSKSRKKASVPIDPNAVRIYTIEVMLIRGYVTEEFAKENPTVSRWIEIRGDQTLDQLHWAIYDAMNRYDDHMYEFQFGKKPMDPRATRYGIRLPMDLGFGDEPDGYTDETTLDALGLKVGSRFYYWFDFGDDWWHALLGVACFGRNTLFSRDF